MTQLASQNDRPAPKFSWFIPIDGDGEHIGTLQAERPPTFDYLRVVGVGSVKPGGVGTVRTAVGAAAGAGSSSSSEALQASAAKSANTANTPTSIVAFGHLKVMFCSLGE